MMSASLHCARTVIAQLVAQGLRELVLCPGSRSAPFALAAHEADADGRLRLHVRVDERAAGFLALGLAKASKHPVAVVTTSGTAVGNLLPSVMEAAHARVGLIVISADRPAALVGFGANQTTDQVGLFGGFVRFSVRMTSSAQPSAWAAQAAKAYVRAESGPVQLNVELGLPLVDESVPPEVIPTIAVRVAGPLSRSGDARVLSLGPRTIVIAGDAPVEEGRQAAAFAAWAGLPLIAEPSSNARVGRNALRCGRLVLAGRLGDDVECVVVFGRPTLSRPIMQVLAREDVEVIVVTEAEDWPDPGHRVSVVTPSVGMRGKGDQGWLQLWQQADAAAAERVAAMTQAQGLAGLSLAHAVWQACSDEVLVLAASQLVRDADLAPVSANPPDVYANRGLAGIDGTVGTALGIALATRRPTTLLVGDVAFIHDANSLAMGVSEPKPDLRIIVGDDHGCAIFSTLEYGAPAFAGSFERVFGTDPAVDCAALAASYGVPVTRVESLSALDEALRRPVQGVSVVVVALDRSRRREQEA